MVSLRVATVVDIDRVLALWQAADAEPTHTDDRASLRQLLDRDPEALIVAESDAGAIVGSVIAAWNGWRGSIYRLVVVPAARRQGLGHTLLRAAEARFERCGVVRSETIVVASDARAAGFWRSTDWEEQVDRVRFVNG
jgi:ribosomal protein S18 acetylase RimI-like enzyme